MFATKSDTEEANASGDYGEHEYRSEEYNSNRHFHDFTLNRFFIRDEFVRFYCLLLKKIYYKKTNYLINKDLWITRNF